ncbi:hypothetical protein [Fretibacterium sp. OH1220_COT-178]|uniref:hypothetical protein n=1 Tax=Fretibacterium sp. OH1220_COT-178 TaxID=2491047 RepID=UPI000F5D8424|nr:hypothetical protein [Fretibacterium sp. OH1220_COT-178]RRD66037.1 hypothetical protein EII26_01180 [Fretibacterium sp. OH1220_COT-178]
MSEEERRPSMPKANSYSSTSPEVCERIEVPHWLNGERRRRLFLACRNFVLQRRAVQKRMRLFAHQYCVQMELGLKDTEASVLERIEAFLDERIPIPHFARLKMERRRLANKFYWGQNEIAIVMGRDQSNVSRLFRRMKQNETWAARLDPLYRRSGRRESYDDGIFALILDFCEEEYLERLIRPRRGKGLSDEKAQALRTSWGQMRRALEGTWEESSGED